ncbi:MAG: hypothetical protein R3C40_01105 [Parvularculaceae bacterium]
MAGNHLRDYPGAVILVTHDRYFLDNVTGWILELDRGRGFPHEGNYSSWLEAKRKRVAQEEREEANRKKSLDRESDWINASPKARQAKSKARINAYEDLLNKAGKEDVGTAQIQIPPGPRLGGVVIEADNLKKGFGEKLLFETSPSNCRPAALSGLSAPTAPARRRFSVC